MYIRGLQKTTLLDYPGKVAATVFLGGCDFRCPYCHNAQLLDNSIPDVVSEETLFSFLAERQGLLDGVVITGGEPCLNNDLPKLLRNIKDYGYLIKLDTNGNTPAMLGRLISEHLVDYVAMDIKSSLPNYGKVIGFPQFNTEGIQKSAALLMNGNTEYEFRTTVVKDLHQEYDFKLIGQWLYGAKNYYLQQFVNRYTVPDKSLISPDEEELKAYKKILKKYMKNVNIRGI